MDHALGEEPQDGLVERHEPEVAHHLRPEARVDEVQDGVLDATHVEVDREPVAYRGRVHGAVVLLRREVAVEVPGRVHEGVHGVGLAPGRPRHFGQVVFTKAGTLFSGIAAFAGEGRVLGQDHGQRAIRHRLHPVLLAVDDGYGRAPVALPADQPVLEAIGDDGPAEASGLGVRGHARDRGGRVEPRPLARVRGLARPLVGSRQRFRLERRPFGLDHDADGERVLLREVEVALVVGGHGHDGARAVAHEDEVAHPDRDELAGEGVRGVASGEDALLLDLALEARPPILAPQALDRREGLLLPGRSLDQALDPRVLGGQHHEGGAEDGVDAGGEDADGLLAFDREVDLGPRGAADPVPLLDEHAVRPAQGRHVVEELVLVGGDAQEPLVELALLHDAVAAPAGPALGLLVGEDGLAGRAPVDLGLLRGRRCPSRASAGRTTGSSGSTRGRRWRSRGSRDS